MIVVEVFIIHILSRQELNMNPPIIDLPPVPVNLKTVKAIRLCRLHFCMAMDKKNPPKNRNTFLLAYGAAVESIEETPSKGKTTNGISAVIAIGTASVAHQIPIQTKIAAALWASIDKVSGLGRNNTTKAPRMPRKNPIFLFLL
jgi:hypothetical protein